MRALLSALQIAPGVSGAVAVARAEELSARAEAFNTIARAAGMPYQPSDVKRSTEEILAGMEGSGELTRALKGALNQVGEAAEVPDGASVAEAVGAVRELRAEVHRLRQYSEALDQVREIVGLDQVREIVGMRDGDSVGPHDVAEAVRALAARSGEAAIVGALADLHGAMGVGGLTQAEAVSAARDGALALQQLKGAAEDGEYWPYVISNRIRRLDQALKAQAARNDSTRLGELDGYTDRYAVICAVLGVSEDAPLADTVRIVAAGRA